MALPGVSFGVVEAVRDGGGVGLDETSGSADAGLGAEVTGMSHLAAVRASGLAGLSGFNGDECGFDSPTGDEFLGVEELLGTKGAELNAKLCPGIFRDGGGGGGVTEVVRL